MSYSHGRSPPDYLPSSGSIEIWLDNQGQGSGRAIEAEQLQNEADSLIQCVKLGNERCKYHN